MARRRKKKVKRVASVDEIGILKRDLKQTIFWISIAVLGVFLFAAVQKWIFPIV